MFHWSSRCRNIWSWCWGGPGGSATFITQVGYTSGGGAGGIFYTTAFEVGPGTHAVTVGAQGTSPNCMR